MMSTRICGGHLEIEFNTINAVQGTELVVGLTPRAMRWDGEEVSDVVAEALALTWCAAHPADEDDDQDDDA